MNNPFRKLRIGSRLFLIVLVMMVLILAVSSFIYSYFESTLVGEVQDQSESLSKALQISVQQMTSQGITDDTLLKDYVERLSSSGVKEISILSNEKEVVASSNPARVGKKLAPKGAGARTLSGPASGGATAGGARAAGPAAGEWTGRAASGGATAGGTAAGGTTGGESVGRGTGRDGSAGTSSGGVAAAAAPGRAGGAEHNEGLVITGTLSEEELGDTEARTSRYLDIPIIVDNEKRGYIRLHLLFDDFSELIRTAHKQRLIAMLAVFAAGTAGIVGLSLGLTRSLSDLAAAADRVAKGDLSAEVATKRGDEVGRLIETFNQMVEKLREQRALEERLRRAEHLSAIGKLASAVAHEVRNPLNLISLSVGHLGTSFRPADPDEAIEYQKIIASLRDELKRLNRMVSDFLSYGRPPRLALRECRVEEILEEVLSLTEARAREQGIEIARRVEAGLPSVTADAEALKTCFLNVVVNGLQAMTAGGRLSVSVSRRPDLGKGAAVLVEVSDTGCGIERADLERIFEPYFSTRDAGVGLGLAITQRIVQEHGGDIHVSSTPGVGTSFSIEIPVSGPKAVEVKKEAA